MSTEEVLQALTRYTKETNDSERQTATKLGVNCMTLSTWLHGKEPPQKCTLARLAGFLRRVGGSGANFKKGRRADPGALGERESLACHIGPKFKLCTRSCLAGPRNSLRIPNGVRLLIRRLQF